MGVCVWRGGAFAALIIPLLRPVNENKVADGHLQLFIDVFITHSIFSTSRIRVT